MSGATNHFTGPMIVGPSNGPANPANVTALGASPTGPAPSQIFCGVALVDPRFPYRGGGGIENNALLSVGIGVSNEMSVMDQAPSTAVVNNIAAAAATTSGTAMTLVSSTAAGVTVLAAALQIPQTGVTIASGTLALDLAPALVMFGANSTTAVQDPTKNIARCVSVTAASGAVGGNFLVAGADLYGYPLTELITVASSPSGSTTTKGKKAFKFVSTVTPRVTSAFTYSVGTADTIGFPVRVDTLGYVRIGYAGSPVTASTGFLAADTATATNTTGDTRGTYALQSVADGVKVLTQFISISPANLKSITGVFGVTPA